MAIAVASRVALKVLGVDLTLGQVTAQPPVFGVSETAGGGPYVVDWDNGVQNTVPVGVLDELFEANDATKAFLGKVVTGPSYSSAYSGLVVSVYNRNATQECVLIKTLQSGVYIELDATTVVLVPGL